MWDYQNLRVKNLYLNIIKVIYYKTIANILLNEETQKNLHTHIHTHLEQDKGVYFVHSQSSTWAIRQEKNKNKKVKNTCLCLFLLWFSKRSPRLNQKTLRTDEHFQQSVRIQNQHIKTVAFLYNDDKHIKNESSKLNLD